MARSPVTAISYAVGTCRFLRRMLATSIEAQAASAASNVSFGDGPARSSETSVS